MTASNRCEIAAARGGLAPQLYPVPADVHDDAAWSAYLVATTPEPTTAERIATLIEFCNPYAEVRARSLAELRRVARMRWHYRLTEGPDARADADWRAILEWRRDTIRRYDRLAQAWALREVAKWTAPMYGPGAL